MSEIERTKNLEAPDKTATTVMHAPRLDELFLAFLRLGSVSFGGPAMVGYIKQLAVAHKKWLPEDEFQQGVALCQAVPGATAMQSAAYVGLRVRGLAGAIATYVGFGLPAFLLMLGLSVTYEHVQQFHVATSILAGLRAIVVALIAYSAWIFGRSSVKTLWGGAIASVTALLFLLGSSPFLIVAAAGLVGSLWLRGPGQVQLPESLSRITGWRSLRPAAFVAAFGIILLVTLFFLNRRLTTLGLVMMKVDLFAFGGGYASVPLMYQEVVGVRRWLPAAVFMDGIALGQITPGPIVITATFVGHQVAGLAGAAVGTVFVFLPSLLMVVLAEPWFSRFRSSNRFQGATQSLVLSFVGLLVSVVIRFAWLTPWSVKSVIIAGLALLALLRKVGVVWVVLGGVVVSALVL
jgi:chromate transporter